MVRLADGGRALDPPDRRGDRAAPEEPAQPAAYRERLERGGDRDDGVAAVSCVVPVFRAGGALELPALSAERGFVFGRAVQYRFIRAADADGGAGVRTEAG